jgi:hypothetical protein
MSPVNPANNAEIQDLDALELLEWRDLQNAQMDCMMHVWDNPEDEVWNDAPVDAPSQTTCLG